MNNELQAFARTSLKEGLSQLNEKQQAFFKRMYAQGGMDLDINAVVDKIPHQKLDNAMEQVRRSLEK